MFNLSDKSRSLINIFGIPVILYSIYSEYAFPIMVLIILVFSSIEYTGLVSLLGASINKYILLVMNLIIFLNSIFTCMSTLDLMIVIFLFL